MAQNLKTFLSCLILTSVLCADLTAQAAIKLPWNAPLRMATCELMLTFPALKLLTTGDNALPVVRDAMITVAKATKANHDGTSFEKVSYTGALKDMPSEKAAKVVRRLRGIEEQLTSTNLDTTIVVNEIRGESVKLALDAISQTDEHLFNLYRHQNDIKNPVAWRALGVFLNASMLFSFVHKPSEIVNSLQEQQYLSATFEAVMIPIFLHVFSSQYKHFVDRMDLDYSGLKAALAEIKSGQIFVSSHNTDLPVEFHRRLMNDDADVDQRLYARELGLDEKGDSHIGTIWKYFFRLFSGRDPMNSLDRAVTNAGDNTRTLSLDHVVFWDELSNEPVWLFVYRAQRNLPAGRSPKKREEPKVQETYAEEALAPVRVR
jgi:hypothetical protein